MSLSQETHAHVFKPPSPPWMVCFFLVVSVAGVVLCHSEVVAPVISAILLSLVTPAEAFLTSVTAKLKGADMYNDDRYQYKAGGIIKSSRFKAVFLIWILKF